MKNLNVLDWIVLVLLVIGGLNWGLVGLFEFDLVNFLFSSVMILAKIIYVVVGLSAIYVALVAGKLAKK